MGGGGVTKSLVKLCFAALGGLLFLSGFVLLLGQASLWGGDSQNPLVLLLVVGTSLLSGFPLGWFNSRSFLRGLCGSILATIVGVVFGYLVLAPIAEAVLQAVAPYSDLVMSGSFSAIWYLVTPVVIVELVTDAALERGRWRGLAAGALGSVLLLLAVELLTMRLGQNSVVSLAKLLFYCPFSWGIVVMAANSKAVLEGKAVRREARNSDDSQAQPGS